MPPCQFSFLENKPLTPSLWENTKPKTIQKGKLGLTQHNFLLHLHYFCALLDNETAMRSALVFYYATLYCKKRVVVQNKSDLLLKSIL
jgi:hypothetical protein